MSHSSPLEHSSVVDCIRRVNQMACLPDGSEFQLSTFTVKRFSSFRISPENPGGISLDSVHIISVVSEGEDLSAWMKNTHRRELIDVSGLWVCPSCKTSAYVRRDEKLNCNRATCRKCYATALED